MRNFYKYLGLLTTAIFAAGIFSFIAGLFSLACIYADDTDTIIFSHIFESYPNGLIIPGILDRFFGLFLPLKFNFNPSYFKSNYFSYIAPLFVLYGTFALSLLMNKKNNILLPVSFGAAFIFLFKCFSFDYYALTLYDGLFRMILPVFFFMTFLFFVLSDTEKSSGVKKVFALFFAFIGAISNEIICIAVLFSSFIYLILSVRNAKFRLFNVLVFFIGILSFVLLYKFNVFSRNTDTVNIFMHKSYLLSVLKTIPEFTVLFFEKYFSPFYFVYVLMFIEFLVIIFTNKKNELKVPKLKFLFSVYFAIMIFYYSLIIHGKTYAGNLYWLHHCTLLSVYSLLLITCLFVLTGILLENNPKLKYALVILLTLSSFYIVKNNYNDLAVQKEELKSLKTDTYIAEKEIRLAFLKKKDVVLDEYYTENPLYWSFGNLFYDASNPEREINPYVRYLLMLKIMRGKTPSFVPGVYFAGKEEALKDFQNSGGIFTSEELNDINFQRLDDDDFVCGKI